MKLWATHQKKRTTTKPVCPKKKWTWDKAWARKTWWICSGLFGVAAAAIKEWGEWEKKVSAFSTCSIKEAGQKTWEVPISIWFWKFLSWSLSTELWRNSKSTKGANARPAVGVAANQGPQQLGATVVVEKAKTLSDRDPLFSKRPATLAKDQETWLRIPAHLAEGQASEIFLPWKKWPFQKELAMAKILEWPEK